MRRKDKIMRQKEKRRLSIFLRPDQWDELCTIKESEGTYMQDVMEEVIDLGLRMYYGDTRETRGIGNKEDNDSYLYD